MEKATNNNFCWNSMERRETPALERNIQELRDDEPYAQRTEERANQFLGIRSDVLSQASANPLACEADQQCLERDEQQHRHKRKSENAERESDRQFIKATAQRQPNQNPSCFCRHLGDMSRLPYRSAHRQANQQTNGGHDPFRDGKGDGRAYTCV